MLERKFITTAVALFLIVATSILPPVTNSSQIQPTKVIGLVVAQSPDTGAMIFTGTSRIYFLQQLLLRVEQDSGGIRKGQYLKLLFNNSSDREAQLPKSMFKKRGPWEFTLTRRETCDSSMRELREMLYKQNKSSLDMKFASWAEKEEIPLDGIVECYEFRPGDYTKR